MSSRKRRAVNYNADSDYEEVSESKILGYIYIVSDSDWDSKKIKIGNTRFNTDRLKTRYNTSFGECNIHYFKETYSYILAEKLIHNILDYYRIGTTEVFKGSNLSIIKLLCDAVIKTLDSTDTDNISIIGINKRKIRKMELGDEVSDDRNSETKIPKQLWNQILAEIVNKMNISYFEYCPLPATDAIKKINDDYFQKKMREHSQVIKASVSKDDFQKILHFNQGLESWDKLAKDYSLHCTHGGDTEPIDKIDLLKVLCS